MPDLTRHNNYMISKENFVWPRICLWSSNEHYPEFRMIRFRQVLPLLSGLAAAVMLVGTAGAATVHTASGAGVDGGNPAIGSSCVTSGLCIAPGTYATARADFESGTSAPGFVVTGGQRETFDGKTPTNVNALDFSTFAAPTIGVLSGGNVAASQHVGSGYWGALIDNDETGSPLLQGSGQAGRFSTNRTASQGTVTDGQAWVEFWHDITIDLGALYEVAGFDIVDLGDVGGGGLTVLISSDGQNYTQAGTMTGVAGESRKLNFFGIYSDAAAFRYIKLELVAGLNVDQSDGALDEIDLIGLDNIFVGNLERGLTTRLPEPGSLALLGLAMLAGGAMTRRRKF